ncbi:dTDP-4-dehydrorhamnose 3,5-epimerase [Sulfodiicoccus acidiphilus]|nr:dTDP-4-dehydrorhamnose 3,5-epimerase [Sulfodiicoccus acidiphilus]
MPFDFERIGGLTLVKPKRFPDRRGFFQEMYKRGDMEPLGIPSPVQVNGSFSVKGVVRGLHYQLPPKEQGKLVTAVRGRILDVGVDVRRGSPTFGQYVTVELSGENGHMLWVPPGYAHGFQALEDSFVVYFVTNGEYSPPHERCVHYSLVKWPLSEVVSDKDAQCPPLEKAEVFP